jgi:hypothetical protein
LDDGDGSDESDGPSDCLRLAWTGRACECAGAGVYRVYRLDCIVLFAIPWGQSMFTNFGRPFRDVEHTVTIFSTVACIYLNQMEKVFVCNLIFGALCRVCPVRSTRYNYTKRTHAIIYFNLKFTGKKISDKT